MPDLHQRRSFPGTLTGAGHEIAVQFRAHIDGSGEVQFEFDDIVNSTAAIAMQGESLNARVRPTSFTLSGTSQDGVPFNTSRFQFGPTNLSWHESSGTVLKMSGRCLEGLFTCCEPDHPVTGPVLRCRLRGFRATDVLAQRCLLGRVAMEGASGIESPDTPSGILEIREQESVDDVAVWRARADDLLDHIRNVMSFAAGTTLRAPVVEFKDGERVEVIVRSLTRQSHSAIPTINYQYQQPIFDAAVRSFFEPPFQVESLFFATEWLSMNTTYNEARLIYAMTALENLVESNLTEEMTLIQTEISFRPLRRAIREAVRSYLNTVSAENLAAIAAEIEEKLPDLNRRSLLRKLYLLADNWGVSLSGITEAQIRGAKRARDLIVHRGSYYREGAPRSDDLWVHVTVIREVVIRLILTAIGYRGNYASFIGGYHEVPFPPQPQISAL